MKRLSYLVRFDEFAAVKLNMLIFLFSYLTWFHVIVWRWKTWIVLWKSSIFCWLSELAVNTLNLLIINELYWHFVIFGVFKCCGCLFYVFAFKIFLAWTGFFNQITWWFLVGMKSLWTAYWTVDACQCFLINVRWFWWFWIDSLTLVVHFAGDNKGVSFSCTGEIIKTCHISLFMLCFNNICYVVLWTLYAFFCIMEEMKFSPSVQKEDLRRVMELLSVREQHARTLLIHYRWDVEKLIAVYVEKGKASIFAGAGVTSDIIVDLDPPEPSTTVMCNICMDDVSATEVTNMDCGHCFCNSCKCCFFIWIMFQAFCLIL